MNVKLEIWPTLNFGGIRFVNKLTVHKMTKFHLHFQLKSKREGRNNEFYQAVSSEISEKLSTNKNNWLNTAFDNGFYSKWKGPRRSEWWDCLSH